MSGIKFGAVATQAGVSWESLLAVWRDMDVNSNFESMWLMDHFVTSFGTAAGAEGPCMESWTALAALAQATTRIRIGILVSGNTYRHPLVLAKQATTVDHISNGRLEFGLGAAWHPYEHEVYGIPFHTTRERLERFDEAVQYIKLLWTEESPTFSGKYYQLDEPPYNPPNIQKPHPPILLGGGGEKKTLLTVAKYADASNIMGTPEEVAHKFSVLDKHCEKIDRDPATIRRTIQIPLYLTEDDDFKKRVLQGFASTGGTTVDVAARSLLIGSTDDIKEQVQAYVDAGVREFMLAQWPRFHPDALRSFSTDVIRKFR
ncbi:MAG: TIGR03560 family F420-dependent LLM class oxidoreductase [Chloroflexi bacterium]|nr:TIGR03560 family F420-dependent LLM class oxidoreductase [Chloroflexota bacterium]